MYGLKDTIFYQILINRDNRRAKYYVSFLNPLEHDMDVLLQYIRNLFPEFPDHGLQHSIRIIEYIGSIMNKEQLDDMSSLEIFIFILAALFHDAGMTLYNDDEKEKIRKNHHCFAQKVIDKYFDSNFNNLEEKDRIKDVVIFVCYAHGISLEELRTNRKFTISSQISFEQVRYGLLAFLLRIGDLMDLEGERVNNFRMQMFSKDFSEISFEHNCRNQNVKIYRYNSEEITIEVEAKNIQQYKIWHDWFSYLENDILCANTYLQEKKYHFPCPNTNIVKADGAKFDVQELRFEIDEKGGIWDIISRSIYTNELDFIRELVQNAIDATLKKVFINIEKKLKYASPRSWKVNSDNSFVLICYSEKQRKLYVIDQGIGMNEDDLKNFLFKVSSSGTVQCTQREFEFPGIAQYGIGFVSCLINAEKIQIFTSKSEESNIHQVTMSSDLNVAFIEKEIKVNQFTGTAIVLELKGRFSDRKIESYLKETFCYPSVDIKYVNLDKAESVMEELSNREKVISMLKKPYTLIMNINNMKIISDENIVPILESKKQLKQFEDNYNDLRFFFQKEYLAILSKKKINEFYRRVDTIKKDIPIKILREEFPDFHIPFRDKLTELEEKELFKSFMRLFDKFSLEITAELGKCDRKIQENSLDIDTINLNHISMGVDWKYFAVFLDDDFDVYRLRYSKEPIDITGGTGLILFKHSGEDFENGIEYIALNGFLFKNGQVYNRLARFTGNHEGYYNDYDKSFVVGLEWDGYDIREQVEEYIENQDYNGDDDIPMRYADGQYVPQNRFNTEYDVIHIRNNQIVRTNNVEVFKTKDWLINEYDENEESINLYEDIIGKRKNELDIEVDLLELRNCINMERNSYYQDGIAISSKLNSLFPIGFFRIVCNCTANARMKLNVTRHEVSEIRTDVEWWINNTGEKIQTMIFDSLLNMLEEEKLYIEFDNLINEKEDRDYFEQECLKSLKKILVK